MYNNDSCTIDMPDTVFNIKDKVKIRIVNNSSRSFDGFISFEAFDTSTIKTITDSEIHGEWFEVIHDIAWRPMKNDQSYQTETFVLPNSTKLIEGRFFNESNLDWPERISLKRFRFVFNYFHGDGTIHEFHSKEFIINRKLQIHNK